MLATEPSRRIQRRQVKVVILKKAFGGPVAKRWGQAGSLP